MAESYVYTPLDQSKGSIRLLRLKRYFWIDALCIDQANDREKGHQVGQMKDVYEKAERVIIWLGNGSPERSKLM
ncbi:hypothetical protein PG991_012272, partial [Apiospora marii]